MKITNLFIAVWIGLSLFATSFNAQDRSSTLLEKRAAAERAWESLIRMKGGREKLYSLTNMLTKHGDLTVLDVFPDCEWTFGYQMDGRTRWASVVDLGRLIGIYADTNGIVKSEHMESRNWIREDRVAFLLETKWNKPEVINVSRISEGKQQLEILETIVEGEQMDFIYEPEEMLVLRIDLYKDKRKSRAFLFKDYKEVDGIKMPIMWAVNIVYDGKELRGGYIPMKYTFNVEYASNLFTRPLVASDPDAWKSKTEQ